MTIYVKKAGILDTIQDCGRTGYRRFGINPSGAMDIPAIRVGNILLGNNECEAGLEMHFPAPVLEFRRNTSFALTGADFDALLNSNPVARYMPLKAKKGDLLKFKSRRSGQRGYLLLKNGFALDEWLGSKSTNLAAGISGFEGRPIRKGDELLLGAPEMVSHSFHTSPGSGRQIEIKSRLRFLPGPAFRELTALSKLTLSDATFLIRRDSNRMGYMLEGPPLYLLEKDEMISTAVTFGTIQLLPNKQLIILMADHQTSGGYPNLGTIIETDLSVAAQLGPGNAIRLQDVSVPEAEKIERESERGLAFLKTGLFLRRAWNS